VTPVVLRIGFGESGFIRIQMGTNLCRIASEATKTTTASADESIIVLNVSSEVSPSWSGEVF